MSFKKKWFLTVARLHLIWWGHRSMLDDHPYIYLLNTKPRNCAPSLNTIWSICWEEIPPIWHTWMLLWHKLAVLCHLVFKGESATLSNYKEQIAVPSFKKQRVLQAQTHLMKCITCRWCMSISFIANIHISLSNMPVVKKLIISKWKCYCRDETKQNLYCKLTDCFNRKSRSCECKPAIM